MTVRKSPVLKRLLESWKRKNNKSYCDFALIRDTVVYPYFFLYHHYIFYPCSLVYNNFVDINIIISFSVFTFSQHCLWLLRFYWSNLIQLKNLGWFSIPIFSWTQVNPLSPSIHIQILQTDLHTFPFKEWVEGIW